MKRKSMLIMLSVIVLLGCNLNSNKGITLLDGSVLTAEEVSSLQALEPEALFLVDQIVGAGSAKSLTDDGYIEVSSEQLEEIIASWIALLKESFGDDYEKYIIEGSYGSQEVILTPTEATKSFDIGTGTDSIWAYYLTAGCKWVCLPWGSYSYATSKTTKVRLVDGHTDNDDVESLRAWISDTAGEVETIRSGVYQVTATGKVKYGFFPVPYEPNTQHEVWDPNITNDHYCTPVYHWTN